MYAYVIRRLFSGLVMLIVMSFATFLMFFNGAVDPVRYTCGKACGVPGVMERNRAMLGYDDPVPVQYAKFVKGVFVGRDFPDDPALRKSAPETIARCDAPCLGYSPKENSTVTSMLAERAPISASLAVAAFIMWIAFGVGGGIVAALYKGRWPDKLIVGTALIFYAFPTFFIGLFLYKFVAIKWELTPQPVYTAFTEDPVAWAMGLFLPGLTLALFYIAGYIRLTRSYVIEAASEDYLRTAKAKGLDKRTILWKHTMRSALTPLITLAALDFAGLLGGAIITETVFNYQGLGKLAVDAATTWDLPVTVGIVLTLSTIVILANIIVDVLYAVIDPRVKLA